MKIVVSSFDAGIVITLFIWYDECRRTKTGHPRGGSITIQKTTCPPCLGEAPRRESSYRDDFYGSGVNVLVHTRFYRAPIS